MKTIVYFLLAFAGAFAITDASAQRAAQDYIAASAERAASSRANGRSADALLIVLSAQREWGTSPSLLREQGLACAELPRHRCHGQAQELLVRAAQGGDAQALAWLGSRGIDLPKATKQAPLRVGQKVSFPSDRQWQELPGSAVGMHGNMSWTAQGLEPEGDLRYFDLEGLGEIERFAIHCPSGDMTLLFLLDHAGSTSDGKSDVWEVAYAPNEKTTFDRRNPAHRHLRQALCN